MIELIFPPNSEAFYKWGLVCFVYLLHFSVYHITHNQQLIVCV